tara:strand:+ start:1814 stop:2170 length:357 start_codon:yes stop_codon:yes gene_type:complete
MSIYFNGFNKPSYPTTSYGAKRKRQSASNKKMIFDTFQKRFNFEIEEIDVHKGQVKLFYYNVGDVYDFLQNSGIYSGTIFSELENITQGDKVGRESFVRILEKKQIFYRKVIDHCLED